MKKNMVMIMTAAALCTALTANAADKETRKERQATRAERRADKIDIDKRIEAVNRLDNKPAAMQAGMAAVSKETAVPLQKIQAEHKEHPRVGLAGLFVAHDLAVHSHKPVDHFIKAHQEGNTWTALATANGLDLSEVDSKLARIEQEMRGAR
jgi:hypothetical protein